MITDILYHTSQDLLIIWQQTFLYIITKKVTEDTAEILMTRITQERAAVSEHTYETAQQAKYGEGIHLPYHSIHLVIEPPAGTKLDLPGFTALEVAQHRGNHLIGTRIQRINDGTCEFPLRIQLIQERGHGLGCIELTDRVDVYANMVLKGVRFFVMMSHVNNGSGNHMKFLTPHYPTNGSVLHFGVSWNFYN